MNRKIIGGLYIAMIVCVLVACSNSSDDSFTAFKKVQKNMKSIKDASYQIDLTLNTSGENSAGKDTSGNSTMESAVVSSTFITSIIGQDVIHSKNNIDRRIETTYNMGFPEMENEEMSKDMKLHFTIYQQGKTKYIEIEGDKTKSDQPFLLPFTGMTDAGAQNLIDISKNMISDLVISKEGDDTIYSFSLKPDKSMDFFKQNITSAEQTIRSMGEAKAELSKIDVQITADKEDMVKSMVMDCTLQIEQFTTMFNFDYELRVEYSGVNTGQTIKFPDVSQYKEVN